MKPVQPILQVIFNLIVFGVVFGAILFLAYVFTKFIGSRATKAMHGKYISVIDSIAIGIDKQVYLLKVGEQLVLIASSGKNIEFLTNINAEGLDLEGAGYTPDLLGVSGGLFQKYLDKFKGRFEKDNHLQGQDEINPYSGEEKEKFQSNLTRLKTMNSRLYNAKENGDGKTDD